MTATGPGAKAASAPPPMADSDRVRLGMLLGRAAGVSLSGSENLADETLTEEVLETTVGSWLYKVGVNLGVAIPRAVMDHVRSLQDGSATPPRPASPRSTVAQPIFRMKGYWCLVLRHSCRQGSADCVVLRKTTAWITGELNKKFGRRWRAQQVRVVANRFGGKAHVLWRGALGDRRKLRRRRPSDDREPSPCYENSEGAWHVIPDH